MKKTCTNITALLYILVLCAVLCSCTEKVQSPARPNLVYVFADQYRKQAVGFMKQDPVITPSLDHFASQGFAFTNAVSTCPICTPYRAILMTGRFPLSTGMAANCMPGIDLELSQEETCLGDVLKANGYATAYIGKWHLEAPSLNRSASPPDSAQDAWDGWTPPGPRRHGFDFWYAYNCNGRHYHPNYWKDTPQRIDVHQWSVEHETEVAMDFIRNRPAGRPFALIMSWNPPHNPYTAPEEYIQLYDGKVLMPRPNVIQSQSYENRFLPYLSAVSSCDENFGRLLAFLDEQGLSENTIVVFSSDHGEMMGSHGRFAKSVWFEESTGIPFIIRWPGNVQPAMEDMPFACYNFMPTLLGLMGLDIPEGVEGTDYSGLLLGTKQEKAGSAVIAGYGNPGKLLAEGQEPSVWALQADSLHRMGIDWRRVGYRGLRTARYTYVVDRGSKGDQLKRYLYDNQEDPYQLEPVTAVRAEDNEIMMELDAELQAWLDKMKDPFSLE